MNSARTLILISAATLTLPATAQPLADNAALRYWSAFAQMQDAPVTAAQAKELRYSARHRTLP
ncbi:MAG: hypothetical protein FJW36_00160 [Acidobacteria bacterium]|nr:hypothetical protein [Acidobacteriota bacterium]